MESALGDATEEDVAFVPHDPAAQDDNERGWTIAHIVAHLTATCEEGAVSASILARGATPEGRPRYEVPWETLTTLDQVRGRLAESRRMSNAYLAAWPDVPHLNHTHVLIPRFGPLNAIARHAISLLHGQGHADQIAETVRQAHTQA